MHYVSMSSKPDQDRRNPFEEASRGRKVIAILAIVPTGETPEQNRIIAEFLANLSPAERAIFAQAAHVKSPSSETWSAVVDAVRSRRTVGEVFARIERSAVRS